MSFLTHCLKYWPSWPLRNGFPAPGQDPWDRKAIVGPGLCPIKSVSSTLVTVACPGAQYKEQWLGSMKLIWFDLIELPVCGTSTTREDAISPPWKVSAWMKRREGKPSGQASSQSTRTWNLGALISACKTKGLIKNHLWPVINHSLRGLRCETSPSYWFRSTLICF